METGVALRGPGRRQRSDCCQETGMSGLNVQNIGADERVHSAETLDATCSGEEIWSYVASRARRFKNAVGMRIQVRDASGGLVLRTGVAAALLADGDRKGPAVG